MTVRTRGSRPAPRDQTRKASAAEANQKGPSSKGANYLLLVIAAVGSLHVSTMFGLETWRAANSKSEIARLETDIALLERERAGLQAVIDHAGDELYREHLARCRGFVYPDEVRFITMIDGKEPIIPVEPVCK